MFRVLWTWLAIGLAIGFASQVWADGPGDPWTPGTATPADVAAKVPAAIGEANTFRVIFFILTFFSIGVLSNFKKLWQEGIGKLAAVYVISLFGFVIWVGLLISWLFFAGIKPPLAG